MIDIITQSELILKSVTSFYTKNPVYFKKLVDIIEKKSVLSISSVEYFTLTYSKINSTMYHKTNYHFFAVYLSYSNFLKSYGKKFTDPFRRKYTIDEPEFNITLHGIKVKTRLAQLHFFKWAFDNEMITYIENNVEEINTAMKLSKKTKSKAQKPSVVQYKIKSNIEI
jgi:hypothetical protein